MYLDEGNENDIYLKYNEGINFDQQKKITIFTTDSYENLSISEIKINDDRIVYPPKTKFSGYEVQGNIIHIKSKTGAGVRINEWRSISPYFSDGKYNFFLWDIEKGLPQNIFFDGKTVETDFVVSVPSNQKISYHQQEFETIFGRRSLFDTLHLSFTKQIDSVQNIELFIFKNHVDPIRSEIEIHLKPEKTYDKEKSHVYSVFGNRFNFMGGWWSENQINFKTRDLVTYTILTDTIPPTVKPIKSIFAHHTFKIEDERSSIKSYRAELDGEFILMRYESKKGLIWPITENPNIPLEGELKIEIVDFADNKTIYNKSL